MQTAVENYFIEGERVCTKMGGGFGLVEYPYKKPLKPIEGHLDSMAVGLHDMVMRGVECTQFNSRDVYLKRKLEQAYNIGTEPEPMQYFYHSDHLGSSSFITNTYGMAAQHLQYLPFGEVMLDERNEACYNTPYKFSAKELDDETQYSYFGARYYDSDLSVWLSVDPLADKYPSMSPFMYCAGNPVMLVDPDGRSTIIPPTTDMYNDNEISAEAQQRFDAILQNLPMLSENKDFMNAFRNSTGLSEAEAMTFLTYGSGPSIEIGPGTDSHATNENSFVFGAEIIKHLGSVDGNDKDKLGLQGLGVALTLIDEITHCGDYATNKKFTGETPKDSYGKQNWHWSPMNHRGSDPAVFGFGFHTGVTVEEQTTPNSKGISNMKGEIVFYEVTSVHDLYRLVKPLPDIPYFSNTERISLGLKLLTR